MFLVLGTQPLVPGMDDDFGDFQSVPGAQAQTQPASTNQQPPSVAANQKLVTSAAGPKAIITEPVVQQKEEKKGEDCVASYFHGNSHALISTTFQLFLIVLFQNLNISDSFPCLTQ